MDQFADKQQFTNTQKFDIQFEDQLSPYERQLLQQLVDRGQGEKQHSRSTPGLKDLVSSFENLRSRELANSYVGY